jgi:hypothetical protein
VEALQIVWDLVIIIAMEEDYVGELLTVIMAVITIQPHTLGEYVMNQL